MARRMMDDVLAHKTFAQQLLLSHHEGQGVTWLFAGPSGVGKKLTARAIAQILMCERGEQGCGECGSCRRMASLSHESYLEIAPDGTQIKVDQAREILEFLRLNALHRHRVVVIDEVHALNAQAANSLLKAIEEPPPKTVFILISSNPSAVLPTLRSRARQVRFRPLTPQELSQIPGEPTPEWCYRAARGSAEELVRMTSPEFQQTREDASGLLGAFLHDEKFLLDSGWRATVKDKGFFGKMIRVWLGLLRDAVLMQVRGREAALNTDQKSLLDRISRQTPEALHGLITHLLKVESEATMNRDPQLTLEEAWYLYHRGGRHA